MEKVIAVYGMSNFGGIEILDIQYGINDSVVYRYNFGTPQKARTARVQYTSKCEPFFRSPSGRVYLNECMRV